MPLPKKLSRTINKFAKRDGKIQKKFHPFLVNKGDMPLYILAQYGRENVDWYILGVIDKWSADFDKYRDKTIFSVSTVREDFGGNQNEKFYQVIGRASHVAKGNGEIYSLRNGDTVQAFQFDFSYKFYAELEAQKTFDLDKAIVEPES